MDDDLTLRGGGPVVEGYRTGRLLGAGGQGEVWAGVDDLTGEAVALKVVRAGAARERLLRECALLRRVEHDHLVSLRDVLDAPGWGTVLVLDAAAGGSLAALVAARGPLDEGEVVTVLCPLARALADLHGRGVVHGDVAPGNVLFTADARPLLSDLGLAAAMALPEAQERYGTPGFADPGGATASAAGDVRALAAVGWFALTGAPPPAADGLSAPTGSGDEPCLADGTGRPAAPGDARWHAPVVGSGLQAVLAACLHLDPDGRPDAAMLARQVWDAAPASPVRLVAPDPAAPVGDLLTRRLGQRLPGADPAPQVRAHAEASRSPRPVRSLRSLRARRSGRPRRGVAPHAERSGARGGRRRAPSPPWWRRPRLVLPAAGLAALGVAALALLAAPGAPGGVAPARPVAGTATGTADPVPPTATPPGRTGAGPTGSAHDPASDPARYPARDPAAGIDGPAAAARALTATRAAALAAGDAEALRSVTVPGSAARAADERVLAGLAARSLRLAGLSLDVTSAEVLASGSDRARVRVEVATSAHRRVRDDGTVVTAVPASAPTTVVLTLRAAPWRVAGVEAG